MGSALLLTGLVAAWQSPQAWANEPIATNTAGTDLFVTLDGSRQVAPGQQFGYALQMINRRPQTHPPDQPSPPRPRSHPTNPI